MWVPYSMESVALKSSWGTWRRERRFPSSRRMNPAADFKPCTAVLERSKPSMVLTYTVQ